jgi:3-methyladenine DNA glycosylase AlkD
MAETKYKEFSQSLIPGSRPILGVRIPALRNLAKEIAKGDWKAYLDNAVDDTFEEVNLQGFVIGYAKADYETLLPYIKKYVAKINDWSLCDGFCATLKVTKRYKSQFNELLKEYAEKNTEFDQRFVAVMLMDYYLEDEDIDETFAMLDGLKNDSYYCKMGVAWAVATAMAKQREKTWEYMQQGNNTLDDWTYNKSIQKMIESYRISDEDKAMLRQMKR